MQDVRFDQFVDGGEMMIGDIPVGLRSSDLTNNYQFNFPGTGIKDSDGNYLFQYETVGALAVNRLLFSNSATGESVLITAAGGDTNISISILPLGTGALYLDNLKWPTSDGLANTFIYTDGAGNLNFTPQLTNGQLFIGSTGILPVASTLTAGTNVTITNSAGSITISASGVAGFMWNIVTGSSQTMVSNNGYISNNSSLVTLDLPATSIVGSMLRIVGEGTGGWLVQCGAGQTIVIGSSSTSSGGSVASTGQNDTLAIVCTVANTKWIAIDAPQSSGLTIS